MSYSFEDFFSDKLYPGLKTLVQNEGDDLSEKFLNILKDAFSDNQKGRFASIIIQAVISPNQDISPDKMIRNLFQITNEDLELRKIEYTDGDAIIKVNYNGLSDEQEFLDKIAEKLDTK